MDVMICKTVVWYTGLSSSNRLKVPFKILGMVAIMMMNDEDDGSVHMCGPKSR